MVDHWDIKPKLERLHSASGFSPRRKKPLPYHHGLSSIGQATIYANTPGERQWASKTYLAQGFNLWQPAQCDSDFASIGECFLERRPDATGFVKQASGGAKATTPFIGRDRSPEYPTPPPRCRYHYQNYEASVGEGPKFFQPPNPSKSAIPSRRQSITQYGQPMASPCSKHGRNSHPRKPAR